MKEIVDSFNFTDLKEAIETEINKKIPKKSNIKIEKTKLSQYHYLLNQLLPLKPSIENLSDGETYKTEFYKETDKNKLG